MVFQPRCLWRVLHPISICLTRHGECRLLCDHNPSSRVTRCHTGEWRRSNMEKCVPPHFPRRECLLVSRRPLCCSCPLGSSFVKNHHAESDQFTLQHQPSWHFGFGVEKRQRAGVSGRCEDCQKRNRLSKMDFLGCKYRSGGQCFIQFAEISDEHAVDNGPS
jgi:hypothetical protein